LGSGDVRFTLCDACDRAAILCRLLERAQPVLDAPAPSVKAFNPYALHSPGADFAHELEESGPGIVIFLEGAYAVVSENESVLG
jgi:hypothetical protein